jgi:hypothetical protein
LANPDPFSLSLLFFLLFSAGTPPLTGPTAATPVAPIFHAEPDRPRQRQNLVRAWEYRTGIWIDTDRKAFASLRHAATVAAAAGQSLVFCTPFNRLIALDRYERGGGR